MKLIVVDSNNYVDTIGASTMLVTSDALTKMQSECTMADDNISIQVLTYKYRLLPRKKQYARLDEIAESQRILYNAALEERIGAWKKAKKRITYYDQCKSLTEIRKDDASLPANLQRATLHRLELAYRGFFLRRKRGEKSGFPRFRAMSRWSGFGFGEFSGVVLRGNKLLFRGLDGSLRVHMHRAMSDGKILACQFKKDSKGWTICFQVRVASEALTNTGNQVGIDVGLKEFAVLSTGESIHNPRHFQKQQSELRRRQRHLARCKRGSNGRKKARLALARVHLKIRNSRSAFLHQVSARLVRENELIAVEDLNVKGLASGILAKSVNDAGWSMFMNMLSYKAAKAGRQLVKVDARNTTQACSGCGCIVPKTLKDRTHGCMHCGLVLDRDHNAAINILGRSGSKGSQDRAVAHV